MDNILKQRLIGALILIALGVVFWPIIFVEPESAAGLSGARMPPPPAVDTTPIEPPDKAGLRTTPELDVQNQARAQEQDAASDVVAAASADADATADESAAGDATTREESQDSGGAAPMAAAVPAQQSTPPSTQTARSEPPVKPTIDAEGVPVAWILQVVSLSAKANAESVRDDLISGGHKAYVKPIKRGDKTLYRVYVGPKFERARLESIKPRVDRQFGVSSMIVRYVP